MREPGNIARLFSLTLTLACLMSWNSLAIHYSGRAVRAATRASVTRWTEGSASAAVANGKIAFVSDRDGNAEIYTMNQDGSDLNRLTFDPRRDFNPAWSPDGSRIAFVRLTILSGGHPSGEIYVMDADGSSQTRLTNSRNDSYPAWSPDGTKIAFSQDIFSGVPSEHGIYVMNADGSDRRPLEINWGIIVNGYQPAWSPDGSKLAFTDGRSIHSINVADGSGLTQITSPPIEGLRTDYDFGPAWSPDGAKIAFKRFLSCDSELICTGSQTWVVNADGSSGRTLTQSFPTGGYLTFTPPSWSSDGAKIVFSEPAPDRDDLFVIGSDGSGLTNITNTTDTNEWDPSWHPLSSTGCADSISTTNQSFGADGGTGSVEVTAGSECSWAASSNVSWIIVTPANRSGNGSIDYSVAANTNTGSRTAGFIVAGHIFSVTQSGLPVRIVSASVAGKRLFVVGENFDAGAVILRNGVEQKTKNDPPQRRKAA